MKKSKLFTMCMSLFFASLTCNLNNTPIYALNSGALPVTNKIVDNDPLSGEGSMSRNGFDTYISASGLWNGDARKQKCSSSNNYTYTWGFPQTYSRSRVNLYITVEVYLNNVGFTDEYAQYDVERGTSLYCTSLGTVNQNTAPSGWYTFGTKTINPIMYSNSVVDSRASAVTLTTSKRNSSNSAGADAIRYTITT